MSLVELDVEQGTPEWMDGRIGIPTTSHFDRMLTASCKPSAQADDYLYELMGEWIHGEKKFTKPTFWMEQGINMEAQALAAYKFITGKKVRTTGVVYQDESRMVGCSPDGLMTKKGLEIKCPSPIIHLAYLLRGVLPKIYFAQVQGAMWVTGFREWDFMSYHPDYEPLIITVEADPEWQSALYTTVPLFIARIKKKRRQPVAVAMRKRRLSNK